MFSKIFQEETGEKVVKFIQEHPYITSTVLSCSLFYTGKKLYNFLNRIKPNTVLEIDFSNLLFTSKPISEIENMMAFDSSKKMIYFYDFIKILNFSNKDSRIIGLIARMEDPISVDSFTSLVEIRRALQKFSKPKIIHLQSIISMVQYFFCTAFDEIIIVPNPFAKKLLEKWNIQVFVTKKEEYKTAGNFLSEEKYTEFEKEQNKRILQQFNDFIKKEIVVSRQKKIQSLELLNAFIDLGITSSTKGIEKSIIDRELFFGDIHKYFSEKILKMKDEKNMELLFFNFYKKKTIQSRLKKEHSKIKIAVVYLSGEISTGRNSSGKGIFSSDVVDLIDAISDLKSIKGMIVRVNSPGGSAIASEMIRKAIIRAKEKGKIVVISMGSVAASGGYWISLNGSKIVAEEYTFTGSIGVIGLFFNFLGLANYFGITFDSLKTNKHSDLFSPFHNFTEDEKKNLEEWTEDIYVDFLDIVSKQRNISPERVKLIAKGQVYTGIEAKNLGLVDEIGGLDKAVELCKELMKVKKEEKVKLMSYPRDSMSKIILNELIQPKNSREKKKRSLATISDKKDRLTTLGSLFFRSKGIIKIIDDLFDVYMKLKQGKTIEPKPILKNGIFI